MLCKFSPCIMPVQYNGGYSVHWGISLSSLGCSVHWGDIMSTVGGYHDECGGYHEYSRGVQYTGVP